MKILQLCRKFPYPLKDGESIAVTYLAKAYRDLGAELTLLSFNTIKHFFELAELPASFDHYQKIETVYLDNHPKPLDAFLNLFSSKSYHVSRFTTPAFSEKLKAMLQEELFDIIQLESVYFAPYLPIIQTLSTAKIVMRAHNVEFEIWERIAANTSFLPKKWYLNHLVQKFKRYEISQLKNYDLLLAMTQKDLNYFENLGFQGQRLVVPIGLDLVAYQAFAIQPQQLAISFIGSLDWVPNQEGLSWFLDKVWPQIHQEMPALELHIAGRNTPQWVFDRAGNGVVVHGEIQDAKTFLDQYPITIVPLFSGSGMRVKILEGMAMGKIVLTTALGVEGIPAKDGEEVLIADDAASFVDKIRFVVQSKSKGFDIRQKARQFIEKHYDNKMIGKNVLDKFRNLQ